MSSAAIARCRARVSSLAAEALAGARDERDLVALLEGVWAAVADELARRTDGAPAPACRAGCASCCRVNVAALPVEGAVAAAFVRGALGARAAALAAELRAFADRVRWLEDRQRIAERLACPFVDEGGRCAIHPARPLACRGVTSIDAAECRRALDAAAAGDDEEPPLVPMDLLQRALNHEAHAALAEALAARGLDDRRRDVTATTAAFLADPALVGAFLRGERLPIE